MIIRIYICLIGCMIGNQSVLSQTAKDSVQYNLDFHLSGRKISGTFDQLVVGGGLNVNALYSNWHVQNNLTYRFNETNTKLIENNWYNLLTIKYYPNGKRILYPGLFYHYDNNIIYRVNSRHHYGMGIGAEIGKGENKLKLLAAIANEHSSFNGSAFVNSSSDSPDRRNGLFLFKVNHGHSIVQNKIAFAYQLFYFQSLKEKADYDIWFNLRLDFTIWKRMSVHILYDYRFENVHLASLSNYNDIMLFGVNFTIDNLKSNSL